MGGAHTRRSFMETSCKGLAAAGMLGCAGIPVLTTQVRSGKIEVDLTGFPELQTPGKGIMVRAEGAEEPIILVALGEGNVRALSGVCTHLACAIRLTGGTLTCPCHGSTFSLEGAVTRGPAPEDLHEFPTQVSGQTVTITLD
jgi:Rieske Fe-S protein